jgi:zinc protease
LPKGVKAKSVIDKYIKAIGGKENLEKVKDKTTIMSGSVQGMNIKMTIYQKVPNKIKQELDAGVIKQETYYDGKKGIVLSGGNTVDITGEALETIKYQAMMHPIYIIDSIKVKTKLLGVEKVSDKDAYKIEATLPNGKNWIEYFDPDTGYKIKDSQDITVPQGTFTKVNEYSDFRNVDGVIYPFKLKQTTGPQSLEMTVKSIKVNTGIPDSTFEYKK